MRDAQKPGAGGHAADSPFLSAAAGVNFAIQKGIQISRSTTRYYDHNDMVSGRAAFSYPVEEPADILRCPRCCQSSLEATLKSVVAQYRRKKPLTRRFIITEGLFENDGQISNLKRLIELKRKYKFRLILDEGLSFGTLGRTGRGLTELHDVKATDVDMIVGSMANTLGSAGGFCAGSNEVVFHQRINGPAFVYSAALPAMLAVAASIAIAKVSRNDDDVLTRLRENVRALRGVLDHVETIYIPSDTESPVIHLQVRAKGHRHPDTPHAKFEASGANGGGGGGATSATMDIDPTRNLLDPTHDLSTTQQLALLQSILDEALESGHVMLSLRKKLPSIKAEVLERGVLARPSIRIAVTAGLSRKEVEKAGAAIKGACAKVLGKRRV